MTTKQKPRTNTPEGNDSPSTESPPEETAAEPQAQPPRRRPGQRVTNNARLTLIRGVKHVPETALAVARLAAHQRRAYNQCVLWLNRQPGLDLMKTRAKPRRASLQGRLSDLIELSKNAQGETSERPCTTCNLMQKCWHHAPRGLINAGASLAHRAQNIFNLKRNERLREINGIVERRTDWADNPPQTKDEWRALDREERRHAQLTKEHRRTLALRTRKHGTKTLEVDNVATFYVAADRRSISIGRRDPVIIMLRRPVPKNCEVRSFRLVEKRSKRRETANWRPDNVRYEAHITVELPAAAPAPAPTNLSEVVGVRMGVRNTWTTSEGNTYRNDGPRACNCRPKRVEREDGKGNRLVHDDSCPHRAAQVLGDEIIAKPGGTRRPPHRVSKRRRHKEVQRRELLRKRTADRDRVFHEHAQAILGKNGTVRAVAVPRLNLGRMLRSGRGTPEHPGTQVAARTEMNRRLANAALGQSGSILGSQAGKRGIALTAVPSRDSALTCSQCGHQNPRPTGNKRRTQLFQCEACAHQEAKDTNQARVLAQRAYESLTNTPPKAKIDPAAPEPEPADG